MPLGLRADNRHDGKRKKVVMKLVYFLLIPCIMDDLNGTGR